jgi:hypothetical protein
LGFIMGILLSFSNAATFARRLNRSQDLLRCLAVYCAKRPK